MKTLISTALAATLIASTASAQACSTLPEAETFLADEYGEVPLVTLQNGDKEIFVLFVNPDSETWTMLHLQNGQSCFLDAGADLHIGNFDQFKEPSY